jgi:hypothetical protein
MIVRFGTSDDREAIFSLLDELIQALKIKNAESLKNSEGKKFRIKIFNELLMRQDVKIFVAEENSRILGVADLFILPIMRRGSLSRTY